MVRQPLIILTCLLGFNAAVELANNSVVWGPAKVLYSPEYFNLENMEPAGDLGDGEDFVPLYVARHKADKMPGYVQKIDGKATIMTGNGRSIEVDPVETEVLYVPKGSISWVPFETGPKNKKPLVIPDTSIKSGHTPENEPIHVCRALMEDLVVPGFFSPTKQSCTIALHGKEQQDQDFEILCLNELGLKTVEIVPDDHFA